MYRILLRRLLAARLVACTLAGLMCAPGVLAAPFDCYRSAFDGELALLYDLERSTGLATVSEILVDGPFIDFQCFPYGSGEIDTQSRTGFVLFNSGEIYDVTLRGNLGTIFFEGINPFTNPGFDSYASADPPAYRLDFRPRGGRDLSFTYPNGFSASWNGCPDDFWDSCVEFGPFCLVFDFGPDFDGTDDAVLWQIGGPGLQIAPVPVPASLPLMALGLAALGWIVRRRGSSLA